MNRLQSARGCLAKSRRAVALTGAGLSTASGIPDFRSPGGVWSRRQPILYADFLASESSRRQYWAYRKEMYADFERARPNPAHLALARLEAEGRLLAVVTQNIDGLHQDAGTRRVIELHGTNRQAVCIGCPRSYPMAEIQARLQTGCDLPTCDACAAPLKAATVSFGQPLDPGVLAEAYRLARQADLLLVIGSSLVVYPAAALPEAAAAVGAEVVIVNREPTPLDGLASVVLHGEVEVLLPRLVALEDGSGPYQRAQGED